MEESMRKFIVKSIDTKMMDFCRHLSGCHSIPWLELFLVYKWGDVPTNTTIEKNEETNVYEIFTVTDNIKEKIGIVTNDWEIEYSW